MKGKPSSFFYRRKVVIGFSCVGQWEVDTWVELIGQNADTDERRLDRIE